MKQGTGRKKHKKQAAPKNLPCQKNDRAVICEKRILLA